ncbi:hypothetical protein PMAYCL1PPCAC_10543, partial [Pristionchus mayeri]
DSVIRSDLVHAFAVHFLAAGIRIDLVSAICEDDALDLVHSARNTLSKIQDFDFLFLSHLDFIPELEEIIAVGERTLVLCRPPVAA